MRLKFIGKTTLLTLVCFSSLSYLHAADAPVKAYATSLKGHEFTMRANAELFGLPRRGMDLREIQEADVTLNGDDVVIGRNSEWLGKYFVSQQPYTVRDVKYDSSKDRLQVKVWGKKISKRTLEDEIKIDFPNANQLTREQFDKIFYMLFFKPDEPVSSFVEENDKKLIDTYLTPQKEIAALSGSDRKKLLDGIKTLSLSPKPELEHVGDGLYVPVQLLGDGSEYNDLKVTKYQRLASAIEAQIPELKTTDEKAKGLPAISGVRFHWLVFHRDFLNASSDTSETIEIAIPLNVLNEFASGNLSAFELTQKSILRVNGMKVTLTSYEPIGAR